jgi:hypothetical protein
VTLFRAAASVTRFRVVALTASGVVHADPATPAHEYQVVGIALASAGAGQSVDVQSVVGTVTYAGWSWSPGDLLVPGTGGVLQTSAPAGWVRVVAVAVSSTTILALPGPRSFTRNFTSTAQGLVPASGGGTTNYLRADGTWGAPPGSGSVSDGDKGDVTVSSGGATWTIDAGVVTNAKLASVATATFKGRTTAGAGAPEDLTATQATALLNVFTSGLKGLAPASGGGTSNFLRADGTWAAPPGGAGSAATTVEVDLGSTLRFAGKFTITDAGISGTSKVLCWQAPGPYTGKGTRADEAEMQPVQVIAVEPGSGTAVVKWQTPPITAVVPIDSRSPQLGAGTLANSGTNRDLRFVPFRRGRVRGNVKFSYMVLA